MKGAHGSTEKQTPKEQPQEGLHFLTCLLVAERYVNPSTIRSSRKITPTTSRLRMPSQLSRGLGEKSIRQPHNNHDGQNNNSTSSLRVTSTGTPREGTRKTRHNIKPRQRSKRRLPGARLHRHRRVFSRRDVQPGIGRGNNLVKNSVGTYINIRYFP